MDLETKITRAKELVPHSRSAFAPPFPESCRDRGEYNQVDHGRVTIVVGNEGTKSGG